MGAGVATVRCGGAVGGMRGQWYGGRSAGYVGETRSAAHGGEDTGGSAVGGVWHGGPRWGGQGWIKARVVAGSLRGCSRSRLGRRWRRGGWSRAGGRDAGSGRETAAGTREVGGGARVGQEAAA